MFAAVCPFCDQTNTLTNSKSSVSPSTSLNNSVTPSTLPQSDLDTMRRQPCFMTAWGETICQKDKIFDGQTLVLLDK